MACCESGTNIFSAGAGNVAVIDDDTAIAFSIYVDNATDTINNLKGIITSIGISAQGGYQFMHAMREFIYLYVFTERVGEIVINGMAFPSSCSPVGPQDDQNNSACVHGNTGLERVLTWYECNRVTTRAAPVIISFGNVSYVAFLTALKADIVNAETGIAQFTMRFNYIPNISLDDEMCFPLDESCVEFPCGD